MAKKDDKKTLPPIEEWLAPWEVDKDGKKLDEPADLDPERLKKHLYNLLSDKERLQSDKADLETEVAQAKDATATLQREKESDEERRTRENAERDQRYAKLEAEAAERRKIEAIEEAFEDKGITPAQARKLAKRIKGDDEKSWIEDAEELVEDGFKVGTPAAKDETIETGDDGDDLSVSPRPSMRRANGGLATAAKVGKKRTPEQELEDAGIFRDSW